jgi:predicted O-methyltransferase YrrM
MKHAADAIVRPEQAAYLEVLNRSSIRALAAIAGAGAIDGRDPLLAKMEARAAARGYPISDPEVACLLSIVARIARPRLVVELGTNIGY